MCRQVLHRTLVLRTTVSDSLMAAKQYDHGPKITTNDWQMRSAGDEEVTNLEARGFDGWDHRRRRALVCGCVVERCPHRVLPQRPTRVYRAALESGFTDGQWQAIKRGPAQMPVHSDTNGMGAQTPTEKYGVRSPFHAGGGGGGGGGSGAATQVLDGGSNTVPDPHAAALLTPVETTVTRVSGANVAAAIIAKR